MADCVNEAHLVPKMTWSAALQLMNGHFVVISVTIAGPGRRLPTAAMNYNAGICHQDHT